MDHTKNIQTCLICRQTFECQELLDKHMIMHVRQKTFKCSECSLYFNDKSSLNLHLRKHKGKKIACDICNDTFSQNIDLRRHKEKAVCEKSGSKYFPCAICDKVFKLKHHLKTHAKVHDNKCLECGSRFNQKLDLDFHMKSHDNECTECGSNFTHKELLDIHMLTHARQKSFKCSECSLSFNDKSLLNQHLLKHKGKNFLVISAMKHFPNKKT